MEKLKKKNQHKNKIVKGHIGGGMSYHNHYKALKAAKKEYAAMQTVK